jgi:acyl-CoA reductase-like NAD-dependent aldehyde dehydrogenase
MDKLKKFYINGDWVDPIANQLFPVVNPATEKKLVKLQWVGLPTLIGQLTRLR